MTESKKFILAGIGSLALVVILLVVLVAQFSASKAKEQPVVFAKPPVNDESNGAVLGETSQTEFSNPLSNVYVNPFQD